MSYHIDKGVNSALIRLLDELCEWERGTGRENNTNSNSTCEDRAHSCGTRREASLQQSRNTTSI